MNVLLSVHYLPAVSWLSMAWNSNTCLLEAHEHYQKGDFRNRCLIAGPNGVQRLSIPLVKGKNQQMPIREVRIANNEPWQRIHWRSLKTAYGNAPYFEHYAGELERFYTTKSVFLFDFNLAMAHWMFEKMGKKQTCGLSGSYSPPGPTPPDFRGDSFLKNNLFFHPVPYAQVFLERHGFLPNLSGIDLLLCCGKQSSEILEKSFSTT